MAASSSAAVAPPGETSESFEDASTYTRTTIRVTPTIQTISILHVSVYRKRRDARRLDSRQSGSERKARAGGRLVQIGHFVETSRRRLEGELADHFKRNTVQNT